MSHLAFAIESIKLTLKSYEAIVPFSWPVMIVSSKNHTNDVIFDSTIGIRMIGGALSMELSIVRVSMMKSSQLCPIA